MKKLLFLWFLSVAGFDCLAQFDVYHPFPTSNAIWRESSGGFECGCCSAYQYQINGDTLINGLTYHKIQNSGASYSENAEHLCSNLVTGVFNRYVGAFRNDSINKKIYFVPYYMLSDTLLYDFDLNIGDTLPLTFTDNLSTTNYVDSIDSVYIGNSYRKRFYISCMDGGFCPGSPYVQLIEGIGSTFGLLGYIQPPFEAGSTLLCFKQNGNTAYPDSTVECLIATGINSEALDNIYFSIYPNPAGSSITIQVNKHVDGMQNALKMFTTTGQVVLQTSDIPEKSTFDISHLSTGVYYATFTAGERIVNTKFIKAD